jgi:hypothetical protein
MAGFREACDGVKRGIEPNRVSFTAGMSRPMDAAAGCCVESLILEMGSRS